MTNPTLLRRVLLLDALVCAGFGALLLAAAGPLGALLALPPGLLRGVGAFLIPFTAVVAWIARRAAPSPRTVITLAAFDAVWAVESVAILVLGWVSPNALGTAFVLAQAALVLGFGAAKWMTLRAPAVLRAA